MTDARLGPDFGWLWSGNASANLADGILLAGLPVLATTVTTSPGLVAGVHVVTTTAMCLAALPAGMAADGSHRTRVVIVADLVRAVGLVTVLVVGWRYGVGIGGIYAAALLAGSTQVLADATSEAMVPRLVGDRQLERANARMVGTQVALNQSVGAPVGSALAATGVAMILTVPAMPTRVRLGGAAEWPEWVSSPQAPGMPEVPPTRRDGLPPRSAPGCRGRDLPGGMRCASAF